MEKIEEKRVLRREAAESVGTLAKEERSHKSRAACARLLAVPEVRDADVVLLYAPLPDELDIWPALHGFADAGKRVLLPKCRPTHCQLLCIEVGDFKRDLVRGTFNILEPKSEHGVGLAELDVVIAPARAFDHTGNRLGRGAGYYDRFFVRTGLDAFRCGIAYDCQMFPEVPMLPHDVPVDVVVTESSMFRGGGADEGEAQQRTAGEPAEDD